MAAIHFFHGFSRGPTGFRPTIGQAERANKARVARASGQRHTRPKSSLRLDDGRRHGIKSSGGSGWPDGVGPDRLATGGEPVRAIVPSCSTPGCGRETYCRSLCRPHYARVRRGFRSDRPIDSPGPAVCAVSGCGREHRAGGALRCSLYESQSRAIPGKTAWRDLRYSLSLLLSTRVNSPSRGQVDIRF